MQGSRKDYRKQEILEESKSWLEDLERTEALHAEMQEGSGQGYKEEIRADEMRALSLEYGLQIDGQVEVRLSDDKMTCFMDLYPPSLDGKFPEITDINEAMESCGITERIQGDVIVRALEKLREKRETLFDIVLLKGRRPENRILEHMVLEKELTGKRRPEEQGGQIDHREFSPYHIIKEGQIVGHAIPEKPGREGRTVTGQTIPFETIAPPSLQPGSNVDVKDGKLVALRDGRLAVEDGTVSIREILEIKGDVSYGTGHVSFPGDIVINGIVKDGFKVKAGQNLVANETLDVTEVDVGGDIIAAKGIIGRKDGTVRARGSVRTKFIEQCHVESEGPVQFDAGIMNCVIHTGASVLGGEKSIIVGGKIICRDGVNVQQVGNRSETKTTIIAGVDFVIMNKLDWIRTQNIEMTDRINKIRHQIAAAGDASGELAEMEKKIRTSLRKLNESSQELIPRLHQAENAKIVVRGTLHPGTYVEICHVSYIVERPMNKVILALDKSAGVIRAEQMTR